MEDSYPAADWILSSGVLKWPSRRPVGFSFSGSFSDNIVGYWNDRSRPPARFSFSNNIILVLERPAAFSFSSNSIAAGGIPIAA